MINKKLYRLFVEGKASWSLIDLWRGYSHKAPIEVSVEWLVNYSDRRASGIVALCIGLLLMFASFLMFIAPIRAIMPQFLYVYFSLAVVLGFILAFIGFMFALQTNYNRLLIRDLMTLAEYINFCGRMSVSELKEFATEKLLYLAGQIIRDQNLAKKYMDDGSANLSFRKTDGANEMKNRSFKPRHATFLLFGLVREDWEFYFTEATKEEAARIEATKQTMEVVEIESQKSTTGAGTQESAV